MLLRICRVRGRELAQWLILSAGSAIGTIGGAYYWTHGGGNLNAIDIFTIAFEVAFPGVITGFLALPIAAWVGDRGSQEK